MTTDTHDAPAHDETHGDDHAEHWTDFQYVKLAILLAVITAVEVLLTYIKDDIGGSSCRCC